MTTYQYSAGNCESHHVEIARFDFPRGQKTYGENWSMIADELAEHYHSNHDGWEATWPLELRVYKDEAEVARFSVEREYEPSFIAYETTPPAAQSEGGAGHE